MSRGISPNSTTYELINSCSCPSHKQVISDQDMFSNLKVQVFTKDQNRKNYQNLLLMYQKLQDDFSKISDQKRIQEIALHEIETDERNKAILELKHTNENIFNELNEKIAMNKNLYNENNKLFQELENRTTQGDNLQVQIEEQKERIRRITCDTEEIRKKIINLNQIKERQEHDINELSLQINNLNLHNDDQVNILKNKNVQNCDIINILNEEKHINKNLQIELKGKESDIISNQQQLNRDNDNINLIKNDINNIEIVLKKNSEDISVVNNNILKETSIINQLNIDNTQLNNCVREKDEHIKQINNDNNILKQDNSEINCQNEKLSKCLQGYKKHLNILISQNKILVNEIQTLFSRDNELKNILERDEHLKDIQFENEQFIKNCKENVIACLNNPVYVEENNTNINNNTIKRTYSIDGNKGLNIMDSPIRKKGYIDDTNIGMEEREINSSMSNIIN